MSHLMICNRMYAAVNVSESVPAVRTVFTYRLEGSGKRQRLYVAIRQTETQRIAGSQVPL